jgi:tRNA pseudouridine38-40 synthase
MAPDTDENKIQFKRYLIKVWYFGDDFAGSQRQNESRTVENELIRALTKRNYIQGTEENDFRAAMRTDAGVHARTAVYGFKTTKTLHIEEIDAYLPEDIGVWAWAEVPLEFHPRFEALWKQYLYLYRKAPSEILDFSLMNEAAQKLLGTRNFRLLAKKDPSKPLQPHEITLMNLLIEDTPENIIFTFQANSFLWQLIRRTVNLILDIGRKIRGIEEIDALFSQENLENFRFKKIGPERADGLILWHVEYDSQIKFHEEIKCLKRMQTSLFNRVFELSSLMHTFNLWQKKMEQNPDEKEEKSLDKH